jgi:hypothetical protein
MGLAVSAWFLRRIVAKQPSPLEDDPAGMGTEIGLEVSLGPVAPALAEDTARRDASAAGDDSPMSWLSHRLNRHR